jgi:hypothetical protein
VSVSDHRPVAAHIARYRDERLETVKAGTIWRELVYHHLFDLAIREWELP